MPLHAHRDAVTPTTPTTLTPTTFGRLGLPQRLVTALERRGIREPFPIQAATVPDVLAGRDVLGRAQTGSGKTLAFGLPILARLAASATPPRPARPRALVLVPTRELAQQVRDALGPLGHSLGLGVVAVYGGAPYPRQLNALRGSPAVLVATPGRLQDLVDRGDCSLEAVEVTVLDEADHMADLGFLPQVTRLLDRTPRGGQRLLFSATLDGAVDRLVRRYLSDPVTRSVASAASPVTEMRHRAFVVRPEHKIDLLAAITGRPARTLLFVRTKHGADRLAKQLSRYGVHAGAIHGNLNQGQRQRALDAFAAGRARVLVATDVAARGIHVDDVDLVVHVDPPADAKAYLHRSGRTARAGAPGTVLSVLLPAQVKEARRLLGQAQVSPALTNVHPHHDDVRALAVSGTPVVVVDPAPQPSRASAASRAHGRRLATSRGAGTPAARRPRRRAGSGRPAAARS